MKPIMKPTAKCGLLAAVLLAALAVTTTGHAQDLSVPSPTSAEQVPGPAYGNTMTKEYVQAIGQMAYVWGWPLVNMSNRAALYSKVPEPSVLGGLPIGSNGLAMLHRLHQPGAEVRRLPEPGRCVWHRLFPSGQGAGRIPGA